MLSFFTPSGKVQKDRKIMRETDTRMAKYSRRGLLLNLVAFLICFLGGDFYQQSPTLTVVLLSGLLFITFLRGFYLFRFEQLYPKAPRRWRTQYFFASLLGAIWWAVIMCSVTLTLKMESEAPIFWIYTVIFFSTTAHAFAPYQKFSTLYQFFGLVPGAVSALFIFSLDGYLYGAIIIAFYFMLVHQCRIVSQNYWEKLDNEYVLSKKTTSLEEEKRDSLVVSSLSKGFINSLAKALQQLPKEDDSGDTDAADTSSIRACGNIKNLYETVSDFDLLLNKRLDFSDKVFNVRHELQHTLAKYTDVSETSELDIESSFSSNLPMRLVGDAKRIGQIINSMLQLATKDVEQGLIIVEADFFRDDECAGKLKIGLSHTVVNKKKNFFNGDFSETTLEPDLNFYVCKAIAQSMGGSLDIVESPSSVSKLSFSVDLKLAEPSGKLDFHRNLFSGHSVMLINSNPQIVDIKRQELEALGFTVVTETKYTRAEQVLLQSYKTDNAIESVLYYANDKDALKFNHKLVGHTELRSIHQLIVASLHRQELLKGEGFARSDTVHYVDRPAGLFELECAFLHLYDLQDISSKLDKKIQLVYYSNISSLSSIVLKNLQPFEDQFLQATSEEELIDIFAKADNAIDLIMIDTKQVPNYSAIIEKIRNYEIEQKIEVFVPIVGLVNNQADISDTAYEKGIDDFIVIEKTYKNVERVIRYWATLHDA